MFHKIIHLFSIILAGNIVVVAAENLAPNQGFENFTSTNNFILKSYSGGEISAESPRSGKYCLKQHAEPNNKWNAVQSIEPYIKCVPGQWYRLSVWNRNTMPAGDLKFGVRYIKADGKSIDYNFRSVMKNSFDWSLCSFDFLPPSGTVTMAIYFLVGSRVPSGEAWWDDVKCEKIDPPSLLTVEPLKSAVFFKNEKGKFEPNYLYFREQKKWIGIKPQDQKLIISAPNFKQRDGRKLKVVLSQRYGSKSFQTWIIPINRSRLEINLELEKLPIGTYLINSKIINSKEKVIKDFKKTIYIIRPPKPEKLEPIKKISWDRWFVRVNDKPFVSISMSHDFDLKRNFEFQSKLTLLGNNTRTVFVDSKFGKTNPEKILQANIKEMQRLLDLCFKTNSYVQMVLATNAWGYNRDTKTFRIKNLQKVVTALKDHPALFAWSLVDEPDARKISAVEVKRAYDAIKVIDSNHPVIVNLCLEQKFDEYAKAGDFASYDRYPYPWHSLSLIHHLNEKIIKSFGGNKPLRSYPQAFSSEKTALLPPPEWLRAEIYLCVTQGMTIFPYYCFHGLGASMGMTHNGELQSSIQKFNLELQSLCDVINVPIVKTEPIKGLEGHVYYALKFNSGKNYLFAVNASNYQKHLNFNLPHYSGGKITVLFEDGRNVKTNAQGNLNETFAPYEVHIYKY